MKHEHKKLGWKFTNTALGWYWYNCDTHEIETNFWIGLLRKLRIIK